MSGYPNGQGYYQSYGGYQNQGSGYTISNSNQQSAQRRTSFDTGDDTNTYGGQSQSQQQSSYYGYATSSPQPAQSGYGQQPSLPYRSQSQLGGYQHQSQPQVPQTTVGQSYNPQAYHAEYNPQAYGTSVPSTYGTPSYAHQTYNPSAYGQQTNQTATSYNSQYVSPSGYTQNHAPSLPPRPHLASPQSFPSDVSHGYPYPTSQHVAMPSPPAPAPPPHQDMTTSTRPYSHSVSSYDPYGDSYNSSATVSDVNRGNSSASRNSNVSNVYTTSTQPSSNDPPSRNPSQTGHLFGRHPQNSTLPNLPSGSESDTDGYRQTSNYDDLMHHLDAAIGTSSTHVYNIEGTRDPLFPPASPQLALSPDEKPTHNGIMSTGDHNINYAAFANDSDAEAAAGLAAMQAMDEQEAAEESRRRDSQFHSSGAGYASGQERSDESDYAGAYGDLSVAGGGYAGTMHYGNDIPAVTTSSHGYEHQSLNARMSSMRSSGLSSDGRSSGYEHPDATAQFPSIHAENARVDEGGTGGLQDPSVHARRLSYDDNDDAAHAEYAGGDGIPDLFFHPGMSQNRPLPPPPARSTSDAGTRPSQYLSAQANRASYAGYGQSENTLRLYPTAPDAYNNDALSPSMVPRSTSLASNRSQPRADQPMRSKTDAVRKAQAGRPFSEALTPKSDMGTLDLPAIPRKKFDASKISSAIYDRCTEPWALSSVLAWIKSLTEEETDLKENTITEAISGLFAYKVSTISSIEAESLAQQFLEDMHAGNVLVRDEEWVKFGPGEMSGVMYQLTGLGCYSSVLHKQEVSKSRCYSHLCMRTVKKADFVIPDSVKEVEWYVLWKLTKEQLESRGGKERDRQLNMREMVYAEDGFLYGLEVLRTLYRDRLARADVTVIAAKKVPTFVNEVFGLADAVRKVNEEYLAPQLKYRENEQGPWVVGYSDILREWIRRARPAYVEYANKYPKADMMVRDEAARNPAFAAFLDSARREAISNKLGWDNYLKSPIQRLQRLILQLEGVLKNTIQASDEKTNLAFAIDEIKACAHEMDAKLDEMNKTLELATLGKKLRLRPQPGEEVDLALDHLGRTIVLKGDMMRQGNKGVAWVPCHAILFDHYLVLSKPSKDSSGNELFDVSKPPIPMVLISLETTNEPAVTRSSMRGVTQVDKNAGKGADPRLARAPSSQTGPGLQHVNTGLTQSSGASGSMAAEGDSKDDNKIYYPFKVKHLGKTEVYTLYALSPDKRQEWVEAIISAKTQHAEALYSQNAEPFKLRVLADTAFGIEGMTPARRISIQGTPIDRAVKEVDKKYSGAGRPAPICRSSVNCATVFQQPAGRYMCAIGTDSGVYISEYSNPRGWVRVSLRFLLV